MVEKPALRAAKEDLTGVLDFKRITPILQSPVRWSETVERNDTYETFQQLAS